MSNNSGLSGGIFLIAEWIMKFSLVNLYWILFNLPIVLILFWILLLGQTSGMMLFIIAIAMMLPILLFPASVAMFAVIRDYIITDKVPNSVFGLFFKYYKENYKRSFIGGALLTLLWIVWAVDLYYLFDVNIFLFYLILAMGIILYVFTVNFFSVTVHYYLSFGVSLKNTFLITLSSPILFVTITISSGFILYISLEVVTFLLPFFTFSLLSFFSFAAFYRYYLGVTDKDKR